MDYPDMEQSMEQSLALIDDAEGRILSIIERTV
jgi:hypothetical protein